MAVDCSSVFAVLSAVVTENAVAHLGAGRNYGSAAVAVSVGTGLIHAILHNNAVKHRVAASIEVGVTQWRHFVTAIDYCLIGVPITFGKFRFCAVESSVEPHLIDVDRSVDQINALFEPHLCCCLVGSKLHCMRQRGGFFPC